MVSSSTKLGPNWTYRIDIAAAREAICVASREPDHDRAGRESPLPSECEPTAREMKQGLFVYLCI
jgi:hypothetical protein